MNYLLKSSSFEDRKRSNQKRIWVVILFFVVLMFIIGSIGMRQTLFVAASPIWKVGNYISTSSLGQYFRLKKSLINENQAFKQEIYILSDLQAINNTLQNENANLKDLLGRKELKLNTVLAKILVKPPQTPYDTLTVDVGEDYQVKVGDKVIANANVYVGEISEVNMHSSKVTLYSTPGKKLAVNLGATSISAEAYGMGGGNFSISIPREVEVKEGDTIIIPSIMTNIFGIVEKLDFNDKDSFQTVIFKSPVNISELNFVEIVLNS